MHDEQEAYMRDAVEAILDRYHQTRLAGDPVEFILADENVQLALKNLMCLYMTG